MPAVRVELKDAMLEGSKKSGIAFLIQLSSDLDIREKL